MRDGIRVINGLKISQLATRESKTRQDYHPNVTQGSKPQSQNDDIYAVIDELTAHISTLLDIIN